MNLDSPTWKVISAWGFVFLGPGVRDNRGVIGKSVSAQRVDRRVDRRNSGWAPSILTSMRVTDCVYVSDGGSIRVTDYVYDKNGPKNGLKVS